LDRQPRQKKPFSLFNTFHQKKKKERPSAPEGDPSLSQVVKNHHLYLLPYLYGEKEKALQRSPSQTKRASTMSDEGEKEGRRL